jgi:hypothetical protein
MGGSKVRLSYLLFFPLIACSSPQPEERRYTYYRDAKPIFDAKCVTCHHSGETVAPFALETFEQAHEQRVEILSAVSSGHMPPWSAEADCRDYLDDRSISPEEKATLVAWAKGGGESGKVSDEPAPAKKKKPESNPLSRVDAVVKMPAAYTPAPPSGLFDDERCFLMDAPVDVTSFVTGFEVTPGQVGLVHHFFAFSVAPQDVTAAEALDAKDAGPGWNCFGGATAGIANALPLGAWVPGIQGADYPEGLGSMIEPGGKVLFDIHYNSLFTKPAPDQTEMKLKIDRFARQLYVMPIVDPGWPRRGGMPIKAGDKEATFKYSIDPTIFTFGLGFQIFNAYLHMHQLGSRGKLYVTRDDGSEECLLDIRHWDFHWQSIYWFRVPVDINRGDRLHIQCTFDNSAEHQTVVNGVPLPPRDIEWGATAPNEMCSGFFVGTL